MRADIGFGWIVLFGFLVWVFQLLRAGSQAGTRRPPPTPRPYRPDATQNEGQRLEELIRHLEGRLEQQGGAARGKSTVVIKRPAPAQPRTRPRPAAPARPRVAESGEGESLEAPVDREAEAEALERRRLVAVAARGEALTDADHAAFEARVRADREPDAAAAPIHRLNVRELRDAFVWNEILGPPAGLRL
jgi:hypothetical protein